MRIAASVGEQVRFVTLHYLESQGQGSSYWPRLIGFASIDERAFFELFTSVKGIGNRKALRALALPIATIAEAIATGDLATLQSLPEIGKKTAQTIVLELKSKMNRFLGATAIMEAKPPDGHQSGIAASATAILVQLGENRLQARTLVERAQAVDPTLDSPEALLAAALALRELS
jgi:Holliday junction DNA helicase RuvA